MSLPRGWTFAGDARRCGRSRPSSATSNGGVLGQQLERMAASHQARAYASFAAVGASLAVDAEYVVVSGSQWGLHVADRHPDQAARFRLQAASLGFAQREVAKMWSKLAQICVISGQTPDTITAADYLAGRDAFTAAVKAKHGGTSPKTLHTPLFGLNAGHLPPAAKTQPVPRRPWAARSVPEIGWEVIVSRAPVLAATMQRYLDQLKISLRRPRWPASKPPCGSSPGTSSPTAT